MNAGDGFCRDSGSAGSGRAGAQAFTVWEAFRSSTFSPRSTVTWTSCVAGDAAA